MRLLLADYRQALAELDLPRLDTLAKQGEALADRIPRQLAATDGPLTDPSVLALALAAKQENAALAGLVAGLVEHLVMEMRLFFPRPAAGGYDAKGQSLGSVLSVQ